MNLSTSGESPQLQVHQNAVQMRGYRGERVCVVHRPGNSGSHFIQTTALQGACHVCLHTNNPSIPMCVPRVNDGVITGYVDYVADR